MTQVDLPLWHANDPPTSAEAVAQHRDAIRGNRLIVMNALLANRGCTSAELAKYVAKDDIDLTECRRRLTDLKNMGKAHQDKPRQCTVKHTRMVTWWP